MPRDTSAAFRHGIFDQQTGAAFFPLIEIAHASFAATIRLVKNNEAITRLGFTWLPAHFDIHFPRDDSEELSKTTIVCDDIDGTIRNALRGLESAPRMSLYLAMSSENAIWVGPLDFTLREPSYSFGQVSAGLEFEDVLNEPAVRDEFVPSKFPGLMR